MKAVIRFILVSTFFISSFAQASYITTGTLYQTALGTTIDYWYFYVDSSDTVTINLLSYSNATGWWGRNSTTALDSVFNLYSYDGSIDTSDLIATNDDASYYNYDAYSDGSSTSYDSYLSVYLTAGVYVLLVSDYDSSSNLSNFDIATGINFGDSLLNSQTYADYQLTWSSNVSFEDNSSDDDNSGGSGDSDQTDVPEPPTLSLFLVGLLGLYKVRNKFKWRG